VVWDLCQRSPDEYSLVLADPQGRPAELSGRALIELQATGRVTLYPAEYRLVYEDERE
jgi:hypothetical protein